MIMHSSCHTCHHHHYHQCWEDERHDASSCQSPSKAQSCTNLMCCSGQLFTIFVCMSCICNEDDKFCNENRHFDIIFEVLERRCHCRANVMTTLLTIITISRCKVMHNSSKTSKSYDKYLQQQQHHNTASSRASSRPSQISKVGSRFRCSVGSCTA